MNFTKRYIAVLAIALSLAVVTGFAQAQEGSLAEGHDKYLGSAFAPSQAEGFADYFNLIVSENAGKWGTVTDGPERPMAYEEEWFQATGGNGWAGGLDESFNLAKDNGIPYRMHVMVWGNQQPEWIANLSEAEQLDAITEWFDVISQRYNDDRGGFDYVEVVNEPVNDAPDAPDDNGRGGNYKAALGGDGETGWDWVIESFEMGRTYFPDAQLMLNEFNVLSVDSVLSSYLEIIDLLVERDLIDAVGIQAHAFSTGGSTADIKDHLDQVAEKGLPIHITEMDIDGPDDQAQLESYRRIFPIFWEHEAVESVTFWGYRPGLWRESAFLIEENGTERPAMTWLRCYLDSTAEGGVPTVFPSQSFEVSAAMESGDRVGDIMDCYGVDSTRVDAWSIVGGSGENIFTVDAEGQITLAGGQSLAADETLTLELVAESGADESAPETVTINVAAADDEDDDEDDDESDDEDDSDNEGNNGGGADLPSGGGSSGGSGNALFLLMLALFGAVRLMRRG